MDTPHAKETKRRNWEVGIGLESSRTEETRTAQRDLEEDCVRRSQWRWLDMEWSKKASQQYKRTETLYCRPMLYYEERREFMIIDDDDDFGVPSKSLHQK
jgi:hypothetical protein